MNAKAMPIDADTATISGVQIDAESGSPTLLARDAVWADIASFARLCCRYLDEVYTYVFYQVKDPSTAEKLIIEIFMEAYKKVQTYKTDREFPLWLYHIAHDYMKKDPRFYSNIPFAEKQIVLLKFVQRLNNQEISQITRHKIPVIKALQAQALLHLLQHKSKANFSLSGSFCNILDDCFLRIDSGESMERCLFQNPQLRNQLESLLSLGLYIARTKKVEPGDVFKKQLFDRLNDRLQQLPRQILDSMPGKTHGGYTEKAKKNSTGLLSSILNKIRTAPSTSAAAGSVSEPGEAAPGNANILHKTIGAIRASRILMISLGLIVAAAAGLIFLLSGGISKLPLPNGPVGGCVLSIGSGSVSVLMPGEKEWQEISDSVILKDSAKIKTTASSRASLGFNDGSQVNLGKDTEMEIITASSAEDSPAVTVLKQHSGYSASVVTKMTDPGSSFVIETDAAVISVKGTQFITEIMPDGSTCVSVTEGTVAVSARGQEVLVKAGYQLTIAPGAVPGTPSPISPSETLSTPTPAQAVTYTLNLKADTGGKVISPVDSISTHDMDAQVNITAVPDEGYAFNGWVGDIEHVADAARASTSVTIKGDTALTASFVKVFTLTIRTFGGSIQSPGESSYSYPAGTEVDLQVIPDKGYEFVNWTGDTSGIADTKSAKTTITITRDTDITANFSRIFKLTVNKPAGGWITKPGDGSFTYREGTIINVQAIPDSGYLFAGWTCSGNDIQNPDKTDTRITINRDSTLTAKFILPVVLSTLTVKSVRGGEVTRPGEDIFTCQKGAIVSLRAVPDDGYGFSGWTGDIGTIDSASSPETTITMNGNYNITANFVRAYDLTVNTSAGGTILQPGGITYTYNVGTIVPLKAVPIDGYRFDRWTGDVDDIDNTRAAVTTITITEDAVITANFVRDYTVTVNAADGGTVIKPGCGKFKFIGGSLVELAAVSDTGYTFVEWNIVGGTVDDATSPTTVFRVTGDCQIDPIFVPVNTDIDGTGQSQ